MEHENDGYEETEGNREQARLIAQGNDLLRQSLLEPPNGWRAHMTRGVGAATNPAEVLLAVMQFDDFDPGDDPYQERDFGKVTVDGEDYFFKIDYYDEALKGWGDPLDSNTVRVLTIMRADEY